MNCGLRPRHIFSFLPLPAGDFGPKPRHKNEPSKRTISLQQICKKWYEKHGHPEDHQLVEEQGSHRVAGGLSGIDAVTDLWRTLLIVDGDSLADLGIAARAVIV